jgi:hypothetical protein
MRAIDIKSLAYGVVDIVKEALAPTAHRIDRLEKRLEALERGLQARSYKGVWMPGQYEAHNMVTKGGCCWFALCETDQEPGLSSHWQLAVKKGRDAPRGRA